MNVTGYKTAYFFLKTNLTPRHACLADKTRVFMPRDSLARPVLTVFFAFVKRLGPALKFGFKFPVGGSVPGIFISLSSVQPSELHI